MKHINKIGDDDPTYTVPYDPESRQKHRWEALFLDIPMSMGRDPAGVWQPSAGAIMLPHTAARLAQHVELAGFDLDPDRAQIRRVDLPRGAHRWQDVRLEVPDPDPVEAVHVAATAALTPAEKAALIERLREDIGDIT